MKPGSSGDGAESLARSLQLEFIGHSLGEERVMQ